MQKYKVLIVDDETLARELLEDYCAKIPYLEVAGTCANAIEAKLELEQKHIDILLLDIQMPDLTGLELLKLLKKQPATILTTAYSEYALEGFEMEVIDYLLKRKRTVKRILSRPKDVNIFASNQIKKR